LQFAAKMGQAADMISPRRITERAALTVKNGVRVTLLVAAPKGRLNVGKRGKRIGVRYNLVDNNSAKVFMFGPAHLIERDTKPHHIPRQTGTKARKRQADKQPLFIPGVGFRANANHPGTKGKHPFKRGVVASLPRAKEAAADQYFGAVRKVFR
jgi:hypothetical protein